VTEKELNPVQRVQQNGEHHGLGTANAIAQDSEEQAAGGPAEKENRRDMTAPGLHLRRLLRQIQQLAQCRDARQCEKLLIEAVKQPTQCCHHQNEPVVARHVRVPGPAVVGRKRVTIEVKFGHRLLPMRKNRREEEPSLR
jgi:hypothetical protein